MMSALGDPRFPLSSAFDACQVCECMRFPPAIPDKPVWTRFPEGNLILITVTRINTHLNTHTNKRNVPVMVGAAP